MKDLLVRTHTFTMLTSRLVAIVVFAALLYASSPALAADFAVLAGTPVTCTTSTVTGDVGAGTVFTNTGPCIINGTVHVGDTAAQQAYSDFLSAYADFALVPCNATLTGTLAGITLPPGVYCFDAAATLTGILTLDGPPNGTWLFKIGTLGTGALTGTGFSVVMAHGGQPCNVNWWVAQAATMTDSFFLGNILAGADITVTRGTVNGDLLAGGTGTALLPTGAVTLTDTTVTGCAGGGGGGGQCTPSSIRSEFNGTSIPGGSFIWFNANASIKGIPTNAGAQTVWFTDQVITVPGVGTFNLPATEVTFSASSCASVSFNSGAWFVDVPFSGSDEIFIGGFVLPLPAGLPGGIKNVTWSGTLASTAAGASMNWKWGAAVYTPPLPTDYNALQVKPTHTNACGINNSDHAGTPEAFKSSVIGGARGGGGSNFTGSWSGTQKAQPCP